MNFAVANGGRLLAEGTANAPIRFTVAPGSGVSWGGLTINGSGRLARDAHRLRPFRGQRHHLHRGRRRHGVPRQPHLRHHHASVCLLDDASFLISHCIFPATTAAFEPSTAPGGIKTGGRGIVRDCFFGSSSGYNDIMDFTGGNRPRPAHHPVLQQRLHRVRPTTSWTSTAPTPGSKATSSCTSTATARRTAPAPSPAAVTTSSGSGGLHLRNHHRAESLLRLRPRRHRQARQFLHAAQQHHRPHHEDPAASTSTPASSTSAMSPTAALHHLRRGASISKATSSWTPSNWCETTIRPRPP